MSRVGYWEAAKWIAKVRDLAKLDEDRPVMLKTSMTTGHFGEQGRYQHLRTTALQYAFFDENDGKLRYTIQHFTSMVLPRAFYITLRLSNLGSEVTIIYPLQIIASQRTKSGRGQHRRLTLMDFSL